MEQSEILKLIKAKTARLESVPEKLISKTLKAEKQIFDGIIELIGQLETKNGLFVQSVKNLEIAAKINSQLKEVLLQSEYTNAVTEFAKQFDIQAELNFDYFAKTFQVAAPSEFALAAVAMAKRNAVDMLINRAAESDLIAPLKNVIENSVVNRASFGETVKAIRQFVETSYKEDGTRVDSRILRYTTQISRDAFAVSDRMATAVYSDELGLEWYWYIGGEIATTRAFCRERDGGYYHRKEVELWGMGKKTEGFATPDSEGNWQGKSKGTNKDTIFGYLGGYNCGHVVNPISIVLVPKKDIIRAMDQGFFAPSDFERQELGL